MKFDLAVTVREQSGKGIARQLRRSGKIPAVLYGQGECVLLTVNPDELVKFSRRRPAARCLCH
jgi:large subunit ribosomal protein L25